MSNKEAHIRIVIDTVVIFDGDLKDWQKATPEAFVEALTPNAKPQPWMKGILLAMADAAMLGDNVSIEAWTPNPDRPDRWSMEVIRCEPKDQPDAASLPAVS